MYIITYKKIFDNNYTKKRRDSMKKKIIYRAYITTRNGKKIYAQQYGLKAFPLLVNEE